MLEEIKREIETLEKSATRLQALAQDNPSILKNAQIILTFVYILKFITPEKGNPLTPQLKIGASPWPERLD